jgi:hypothetical protein
MRATEKTNKTTMDDRWRKSPDITLVFKKNTATTAWPPPYPCRAGITP